MLTQLWKDNFWVDGAHKLWKAARRAGHGIGRDQVAGRCVQPASKGPGAANGSAPPKPDPTADRHPDRVGGDVTATSPISCETPI